MATFKKFRKEDLVDVLDDVSSSLEKIEDKMVDQRRWVTVNNMVFQDLNSELFYEVTYEYGSTECQDQAPFEYEPDEIECVQVEPVEVTKIEYRVV